MASTTRADGVPPTGQAVWAETPVIGVIVPEPLFATYTLFVAGFAAIPIGELPTVKVARTLSTCVSITETQRSLHGPLQRAYGFHGQYRQIFR